MNNMEERKRLFDQNQKLAFWVINKYCGRYRGCESYKDLVQDAMLNLWRACRAYDASKGHQFTTLATTAMMRGIWNAAKKYQKSGDLPSKLEDLIRKIPLEDVHSDNNEFDWTGRPIADEADDIETFEAFDHLASKLKGETKTAIVLKYQYGMTTEKIAAKMGVCRRMVGYLLADGISTLREKLSSER